MGFRDQYVRFLFKFRIFQFSPFFHTVATYDAIVIRVILPYTRQANSYSHANSTPIKHIMPCTPFNSTHGLFQITPSYTPAPVHTFSQNQQNLSKPSNCPMPHTNILHTHEFFGPEYTPLRNFNFFLRYVRSMKHSSSLPSFSPVL